MGQKQFFIRSLNWNIHGTDGLGRMGPEEGGSVGSASTGLFSGPDIAAQVQELERRVAQQVGEGALICLLL